MGSHRNLLREVRPSHASYTMDKVSMMCFLAPLASSIVLGSISTLLNSYHHLLHHPLFNILTPSFTFLLLTLILLLLIKSSIYMNHPHKHKGLPPPSLLNFPFRPIEITCFTHCDTPSQGMQGTPALFADTKLSSPKNTKISTPNSTMLARSVSSQDFGKPFTLPSKSPLSKAPSLSQSSSHNMYLALRSMASPLLSTVEDLTDDEANKRFSAFIESRVATMKREVLDERGEFSGH